MNSDSKITAHLSIRPKVNGQLNLAGVIEFFYRYLMDYGWHASYQCCGKALSSSEKKV